MNEPRLMTKEEQSELAALSADVLWTDEDAERYSTLLRQVRRRQRPPDQFNRP